MTQEEINDMAHHIAWEVSKRYDPLLSKQSWCEMAAKDMAEWFKDRLSQVFEARAVLYMGNAQSCEGTDVIDGLLKVVHWINGEEENE